MRIASLQNLNKNIQSFNSLSSMETIDSPVQIFENQSSNHKKVKSRPLINSIISKEDLRQVIAQESYSCKNSLRRLDSYNMIEVPSSQSGAGVHIKSERNITVPIRAMQQQQQPSQMRNHYSKSAAPQEVLLDSSVDEEVVPQLGSHFSNQLYQRSNIRVNSYVEDRDYDSESDSDEHNVWDNSDAEQLGIDVENAEVPFEFCQLFYIRSQLYQSNKVNKNNILDEVQVISNMCKKQMNILRSNKQIDCIEKKYHLSLKKNAIQVSKLKLQKAQLARPIPKSGSSTSLKLTPKAFRISQYPLFSTPNKQTKQSSIPNIPEDVLAQVNCNSGRQFMTTSTINFKVPSCDTIPSRISSNNSPNLASSAIKKVNLKLNSTHLQRPASKLGQEAYITINKQNMYNSLGKTIGHSKFYPMQDMHN